MLGDSSSQHVTRAVLLSVAFSIISATKTACIENDNDLDCRMEKGMHQASLDDEEKEYPCTMYLAESSISNAGIGTYTAIPMEMRQTEASLGGPIIAHIDAGEEEREHGDYFWDENLFPYPLFDTHFPSLFLEFGATNSHPTLFNLDSTLEGFKRDSAGLHRFKDPGAGAFTTYTGLKWEATRHIEAGSELFVDIGEGYFQYREEKIGHVPTEKDYEQADKMIHDATKMQLKEKWTLESYDEFLIFVEEETSEHIRALLPSDFNDLETAAEMGSAKFNLPNNIKTPEWLKENGWCIDDKVEEGLSSTPQAGRGLFAKRSIKKGSTVAPSPVIIFQRDLMDIYDSYIDEDTGNIVYDDNDVVGKQMVLNYCYSHPESTVLIVPNNAVVSYINHDGNDPNAKVRWIDSFNMKPEGWLSKSPEELFETGSGPMMEFYALRDIKPGEEITVDYGPEWEAAWTNHVNRWKTDENMKDYISAADYMEQGLFKIRTETEQEKDPYPENLHTACYFSPDDFRTDDDDDDVEWEEGIVLDLFDLEEETNHYQCLFLCNAVSSQVRDGDRYFEVFLFAHYNLHFRKYNNKGEGCHIPGHVFVVGMKSEAIKVIDLPYTSDEHIEGAFRHEIGVPDGFFPSNWLDIPKQAK